MTRRVSRTGAAHLTPRRAPCPWFRRAAALDARRGPYLKWLFFGPSCIEPAIMDRAFPRKEEARRAALGYGDFETCMNVVAAAVARGPYLLGQQFTAADVVIGSTLRWGMLFKMLPERASLFPTLRA